MKTTDFIKESIDQAEYNDEAGMTKNSLHTVIRVATHLERELGDNENLPEWVQEKIAQIKGMMVSVMDYMISQHEMGKQEEMPSFNADQAERQFAENLNQDDEEPWHGIKDPELLKDLISDAQAMDYDEFYDEYSSMFDDPEEFWSEYHVAKPKSKKRSNDDGIAGISQADYAAKYPNSPGLKFMKGPVTEDAGVTGSSSIAVTPQTLGEKGSFSKKDVNKKLSGYGNVLKRGTNNVKVKGGY